MSLSALQRKFYFSGKYNPKSHVEKVGPWPALCELRGLNPKDADQRYEAHRALGLPESLSDWKNKDFNRFLTHVEKAWATNHRVDAPDRDRDKENALHTIQAAIDAGKVTVEYVERISGDRFGFQDWRILCVEDVIQLRNTVCNRVGSKRPDFKPRKGKGRVYVLGAPDAPRKPSTPHQDGNAGFVLVGETVPCRQTVPPEPEDENIPF